MEYKHEAFKIKGEANCWSHLARKRNGKGGSGFLHHRNADELVIISKSILSYFQGYENNMRTGTNLSFTLPNCF